MKGKIINVKIETLTQLTSHFQLPWPTYATNGATQIKYCGLNTLPVTIAHNPTNKPKPDHRLQANHFSLDCICWAIKKGGMSITGNSFKSAAIANNANAHCHLLRTPRRTAPKIKPAGMRSNLPNAV